MSDGCDFEIGQLIEYRVWFDGEGSWVSIENQVGIVLEIIEIKDRAIEHLHPNTPLYDIKVYWFEDGITESVPALLLAGYNEPLPEIIL